MHCMSKIAIAFRRCFAKQCAQHDIQGTKINTLLPSYYFIIHVLIFLFEERELRRDPPIR